MEEWHRRLGHIGISGLRNLHGKNLVDGFSLHESPQQFECDACIQAKASRAPLPAVTQPRQRKPGELTHSDVWGPRDASLYGYRYYISFVDDATRHTTVRFMKSKDEASTIVKQYLTFIERQYSFCPKALRVDNGCEYINKDHRTWCLDCGIEMQTTAPYTPEQNGIAEHWNRTVVELMCAMMFAYKRDIPPELWPEAVTHATYIRNRAYTKAIPNQTPFELWSGHRPDISSIQEFGRPVWVLNQEQNLSKLDVRAKQFTFIGYEDGPRAIKYYNKLKRTIKVSREYHWPTVTLPMPGRRFDGEDEQTVKPSSSMDDQTGSKRKISDKADESATKRQKGKRTEIPSPEKNKTHAQDQPDECMDVPSSDPQNVHQNDNNPSSNIPCGTCDSAKPKRKAVEIKDLGDEDMPDLCTTEDDNDDGQDRVELMSTTATAVYTAFSEMNAYKDPKSLKEAMCSPEWPEWEKAIQTELETLRKMGTWELCDPPEGCKPIMNKWVFVKKYDKDGNLQKFKARLVARGFTQVPGMDYNETFSPVVCLETIRAILALAVAENWEIQQINVKGAYLNGKLKEEIYMEQFTGYGNGTTRLCHLIKTLYGLKQSGREWNEELDSKLGSIKFERTYSDPCVYVRHAGDSIEIITVWVDNLLLFTNSKEKMSKLKSELKGLFDITDLGEPNKLVGLEFTRDRDRGTLTICQTQYIESMLERFELEDANTVSTPLELNTKLGPRELNEERGDGGS